MPILVNNSTRIICQGIVTEEYLYHVHQCLLYGTKIVAFVAPQCDKDQIFDLPVFMTLEQAKKQTNANTSLIFAAKELVKDAVLEAADANIERIICITQDVPVHDVIQIRQYMQNHRSSYMIGPGSFGIISPDHTKVGTMPGYVFSPGSVGIISRFSTVAYEAAWQMRQYGIGQSTCVGIGPFDSFIDILEVFEKDSNTNMILLIGSKQDTWDKVCEWKTQKKRKPLLVYVPGDTLDVLHKAKIPVVQYITNIGKHISTIL